MFRMVSIRRRLRFPDKLTYFTLVQHFAQRPPIRQSSKLFIAVCYRPRRYNVTAETYGDGVWFPGAGILASSTQIEFLFIKKPGI